jgi:excinuclease ABC subunit C
VDPLTEEAEVLEKILEERVGESVKIREPLSDEEKRLYQLAQENADMVLEEEIKKRGETEKKVPLSLLSLKEELRLPSIPHRIECVDISQLFGENPVGSVVVFVDGKPKKSEYRRFRVKQISEIDDYRMIEEVVTRRFKRLKEEGKPFPDLFLIDGGRGQLSFARRALDTLGIKDVPLVAIAKRFDELHLEDGRVLMLDRRSHALKLLQRIRDEAHRFAVTYHRKLREKDALQSVLGAIPGIGEKKMMELVRYFGSVKKLLSASEEEIQRVKGIGPKLAEVIYRFLHG